MSYNQQQPLNNTANADTTGLAGTHANKTTLGNTNTGTTGMGTTGTGTTTGYGNTTTAPGTMGGGPGTGLSGTDNYNNTTGTTGARTGGLGTQGRQGGAMNQPPLGADAGTEVRGNDHIAQPIDWAAINSGRAGNGGAPYGLTGRAGQGGGVGAPPLEDLGAGNDPTNVMGPSSGYQDSGAGGFASTDAHSAVGGPGVGTGMGAGGMGAGTGTGVGGGNTHPQAGRHGAEAGALAGGVHGHHDGQGHTARDAAAGGAAGGAAGHEVRKHEEHKAETSHKPTLMEKVKNVLQPHHGNNTDSANPATTDNTGTGTTGNVGNTGMAGNQGTGPTY